MKWTRTLGDYPPARGTLKYRFKNAAGGFEARRHGFRNRPCRHRHRRPPRAHMPPAPTRWIAWVESGAEKYTVDEGTLRSSRITAVAHGWLRLDDRSHARKTLQPRWQTWIEGRDPAGRRVREIAGRR